MDQDWAVGAFLDGAQNRQQLVHVVAVDGADVTEPKLLKQGAANGH